jgi:peptidoglycan/LPS O-acetylase OafA/YrhL
MSPAGFVPGGAGHGALAAGRTSAGGRDNAFDFLRLVAAALVLFSHSFVLTGAAEPQIGDASIGFLGVEIFFAISGFLVSASWARDPRWRSFVAKRARRILPGLTFCLVLTALLLAPLAAPGYVGQNLLAVATGGLLAEPAYTLPGVFGGGSVNGSLWTLPIEVQAYFAVAVLGSLTLTRRLITAGVLIALAAPAAAYALPVVGPVLESRPESVQLLATFAVGALLYAHRERIPLRLDAAALALGALAASLGTPAERIATALCLPYLVVVAAYRTPLRRRGPDLSYGVYLFAFPVQRALLEAAGGLDHPAALFAASVPPTFALAWLSWSLVEARARAASAP